MSGDTFEERNGIGQVGEAKARLEAILRDGDYCLCMTPGGSAFADLRKVLDAIGGASR